MRMKPACSAEDALAMKRAYNEVSDFIEHNTASVCPSCQRVCCIDKHGTHEEEDLVFIAALGETPPPEPPGEPTSPCRHLGPRGCSLERWQRPFRCTWYFCAALLEHMPKEDPKGYRRFMQRLATLQTLRRRISGLEEF